MSEVTRAEILAEIGRRFGGYRSITATGGSTTTVISTSGLYAPDDAFVGRFAYVLTDAGGSSAAPEGQERPITDYDQGTATLTVSPAFTAAVASGDIIEILRSRRSDIENVINSAIRTAGDTWLVLKVDDTTVVVADDDYDYDLPTDVVRLLNVYTRDETSDPWLKIQGQQWRVGKTPGGQELLFSSLAGTDTGHLIRLEYLARPSALTTDSGVLDVGEPAEAEMVEYIIARSLYLLHNQSASSEVNAAGFRAHITLGEYWKEEAAHIKEKAVPLYPSGSAHGRRWARTARG